MKQLFHIENKGGENSQQVLSLRVGKHHISFAITNKAATALQELAYCTAEKWDEKELAEFFAAYPSLNNTFYNVLLNWDFAESTLVPAKNFNQDDAALLLSASQPNSGTIISEAINEWQLYNVYAVQKEVFEFFSQRFPAGKFWHQYSTTIKNLNAINEHGSIVVDFRQNDLTIVVTRPGKFLLAQTYSYSTPEDVLYYILKTTQQFSLSQQETELQLSGLIDKQSALYKELYQYFIHVDFRLPSWNIEGEYPAHFFTTLNDLARCAS